MTWPTGSFNPSAVTADWLSITFVLSISEPLKLLPEIRWIWKVFRKFSSPQIKSMSEASESFCPFFKTFMSGIFFHSPGTRETALTELTSGILANSSLIALNLPLMMPLFISMVASPFISKPNSLFSKNLSCRLYTIDAVRNAITATNWNTSITLLNGNLELWSVSWWMETVLLFWMINQKG